MNRGFFLLVLFVFYFCFLNINRSSSFLLTTEDGLKLELSPTGMIESFQVGDENLLNESMSTFTFRDMSHAGEMAGENLLLNPDFEIDDDQDGMPDGWNIEETNNNIRFILSEEESSSGQKSLYLSANQGKNGIGGIISSAVPVIPGVRYRVSAMVKIARGYFTQSGVATFWQRDIYQSNEKIVNGLYISWFDSRGQILSDPQLIAPIHLNAYQWKKISGEILSPHEACKAKIIVAARLLNDKNQEDAYFIDDICFIQSPEEEIEILGTVKEKIPLEEELYKLSHYCFLPENSLEMETDYLAYTDRIVVEGKIKDSSGENRAIELIFRLPLELQGWFFWDDMRNCRKIEEEIIYENMISGDFSARMPISLYPYLAVNNESEGLALAVSPEKPVMTRLSYDNTKKQLKITFYLGISPAAKKLNREAAFNLMLFRVKPSFAFRRTIEKYGYFYPEVFSSPRNLFQFHSFHRDHFQQKRKFLKRN